MQKRNIFQRVIDRIFAHREAVASVNLLGTPINIGDPEEDLRQALVLDHQYQAWYAHREYVRGMYAGRAQSPLSEAKIALSRNGTVIDEDFRSGRD